jgi:hypothetical protein
MRTAPATGACKTDPLDHLFLELDEGRERGKRHGGDEGAERLRLESNPGNAHPAAVAYLRR